MMSNISASRHRISAASRISSCWWRRRRERRQGRRQLRRGRCRDRRRGWGCASRDGSGNRRRRRHSWGGRDGRRWSSSRHGSCCSCSRWPRAGRIQAFAEDECCRRAAADGAGRGRLSECLHELALRILVSSPHIGWSAGDGTRRVSASMPPCSTNCAAAANPLPWMHGCAPHTRACQWHE